ncbi:arylsulfatase B-like [Ornithodoros turicata]|uniref:arylsulfatase B-like n=1 Tax=Ornithodoros turicata TaxID=34597 RepID=UPI00313A3E3A
MKRHVSLAVALLSILHQGLCSPPHIIVVVADDLGWGDVSFHGSRQIPTPNIDALAASGIVLNNYYVSPICTPSRSALLSGRHPIHTGMQHGTIFAAEPWGFPLQYQLMPEFFKKLGYETHAVGKWHIGFMTEDYTPTRRGFDSFYGYYNGHQDYMDHTTYELYRTGNDTVCGWGLDMHHNLEQDKSQLGNYATNLFTERAIDVLKNRDKTKPMFLYLAHLAVHTGSGYNILDAPYDYVQKFAYIKDDKRRVFAAMVSALDDAVGELVKALLFSNMLNETLLVLTTDNGGAAGGVDQSAGCNWPLRGTKTTLWEGGVRGTAVLWGPRLAGRRHVASQLMHITDWLPTLYHAAGGSVADLGDIDGYNLWESLLSDSVSPRPDVLHNIDPMDQNSALRHGGYKLVQGHIRLNDWYKPADYDQGPHNVEKLRYKSSVGRTLRKLGRPLVESVDEALDEVVVKCNLPMNVSACFPEKAPCLFNIEADPCENDNIADQHPDIVDFMLKRLAVYRESMVPPLNKAPIKKALPRLHGYVWKPYL